VAGSGTGVARTCSPSRPRALLQNGQWHWAERVPDLRISAPRLATSAPLAIADLISETAAGLKVVLGSVSSFQSALAASM